MRVMEGHELQGGFNEVLVGFMEGREIKDKAHGSSMKVMLGP